MAADGEDPLEFSTRAEEDLPHEEQMREYIRVTREILVILERSCDVTPYDSLNNLNMTLNAMLAIADASSRNVVLLAGAVQELRARAARLN